MFYEGYHPAEPATVLLVEDDLEAAQTLADILTAHGYKTVMTARGQEALRLAQGANIAVVDLHLTDDMMGLEVIRRLKEALPDMECLVATGYADVDTAIRSLNLGAFAYLRKPIDMHYFLESIGRALEKQHLACTLRQRLREVEAAARLNAQVLNERVQLVEQLEGMQAQLSILHQALLKASQATSVKELATAMLSLIECSDYSCLALTGSHNGSGNGNLVEHCRNLASLPHQVNWHGLAAKVLEKGQAVFLDRFPEDGLADPALEAAGIRSLAALPLKDGQDCFGVLFLHSLRPGTFTPNQTMLKLLSGIHALAWQRLRSAPTLAGATQ